MIDAFNNIICSNVAFTRHGVNGDEWHIKENGKESKISKLILTSIPDKSFAFTLDHESKQSQYQQLSCYLKKSTKYINKGCDLVVVTENDNNEIVVDLVDLKSNKLNKTDIKKQLGNSEIFIDYLCQLIKYNYSCERKISFRKSIIFTGKKPRNKSSTYRGNQKATREEIAFIPVEPKRKNVHMHFGKLITG